MTIISTSDSALLKELHATAIGIKTAHDAAIAAAAAGNEPLALQYIESVTTLRQHFAEVAGAFQANDPTRLSTFDNFLLTVDAWVTNALRTLPGAIAAIPNAIYAGVAQATQTAGWATLGALVPWILVGGLVLYGLKEGRKAGLPI